MLIHPFLINQWQTWLIILLVVLVLFGATRLPALSKSIGQSIKIFRKEVSNKDEPVKDSDASEAAETSKPVDTATPTDKP